MKKKAVKIVTIGGGSSYTPELMEGFIKRYDQLPVREIWLVDVAEGQEKLETVGQMAQRMWDATPYHVKIHMTLDRREALPGADFVTTQFRVGFLDARIKDERVPLSYGMIGQETNGAGGMFKAFRTIPVMLSIVEDMKELCPDAWLINFTNPSGMITEAVMRYGKWEKVIGLCNLSICEIMAESEMLGRKPEDLIFRFGGLNHFHWHKTFDASGRDVTPVIIEKMFTPGGESGTPANIFEAEYFREQLDQIGLIPCSYHRYYYQQETMLKHMLEEYHDPNVGTRAEQVRKTETALFELYRDPALHEKPEELAQRGGAHYSDVACETIASIYGNKDSHIVVCTKNNGALPDLPADCAVEVSAVVGAAGASPLAFGLLSSPERGWLQLMKNLELCVCEAAVTGDYGLALQAFTMNPLIPSGETAKRVLDELLVAHKKYLPQFADAIAGLQQKGITIKDGVAKKLTEQGK